MHKWKIYLFFSDIITIYLALILAVLMRGQVHYNIIQTEGEWLAAHIIIFFPTLLFTLIALYIAGLYDPKVIYDRAKTLTLLIYTQLGTAIFAILSFYTFRTELTPKLTIFFFVIFTVILLSFTRSYSLSRIRKMSKMEAVFWSNNDNLTQKLDVNYAPFMFSLYRSSQDILSLPKLNYLVYDEKVLNNDNLLHIEDLKQRGVTVFSYNQYYEFLFKKVDFDNLYLDDFLRYVSERKETPAHYVFRRVTDIACALLVAPFYLLSLIFIYIGIYIQDGGKIHSIQDRVSFLGRRIWLYKIRTMRTTDVGAVLNNEEAKAVSNKLGNTYTKFGMFLRKSRIDELPQCINLFRGDVSMIGPRADIVGVFTEMSQILPEFKLRLLVPQGLTGWAQVHMNIQPKLRDEYKERLAYDFYYIKHRSILLDISIVFKTIRTLLGREGA